jgi:hypothetical protein
MNQQIFAHLQSDNSAVQACAAQALHAHTGGLFGCLGSRSMDREQKGAAQSTGVYSATHELYCEMMISSRGGIIDVPPDHCLEMTSFIQTKRGVLRELKGTIVSVSVEPASQAFASKALAALCAAGVDPSEIKIFFMPVPEHTQFDEAYQPVVDFAHQAQIPVSPEAVLPEPKAFETAHRLQLPISSLLNGLVDYTADLTAARMNGAPKAVLLALAHKAFAQRELQRAQDALVQVVDALGMTRISQEEWRAESAPVTNRRRMKLAAAG